jgi:hypothetical protein
VHCRSEVKKLNLVGTYPFLLKVFKNIIDNDKNVANTTFLLAQRERVGLITQRSPDRNGGKKTLKTLLDLIFLARDVVLLHTLYAHFHE